MIDDFSKQKGQLNSLIGGGCYNEAYTIAKTCIQHHMNEIDRVRKEKSEEKSSMRKKMLEDSILLNEAVVFTYERYLERILYHQLKNLTTCFEEFISKLVELRKVISGVTEEMNDYWLFWHLPKIIIRTVNKTNDVQKAYLLFKTIQPLPFLREHESTVLMKKVLFNKFKDSDYRDELTNWIA
jgi:hypothetical protein